MDISIKYLSEISSSTSLSCLLNLTQPSASKPVGGCPIEVEDTEFIGIIEVKVNITEHIAPGNYYNIGTVLQTTSFNSPLVSNFSLSMLK